MLNFKVMQKLMESVNRADADKYYNLAKRAFSPSTHAYIRQIYDLALSGDDTAGVRLLGLSQGKTYWLDDNIQRLRDNILRKIPRVSTSEEETARNNELRERVNRMTTELIASKDDWDRKNLFDELEVINDRVQAGPVSLEAPGAVAPSISTRNSFRHNEVRPEGEDDLLPHERPRTNRPISDDDDRLPWER